MEAVGYEADHEQSVQAILEANNGRIPGSWYVLLRGYFGSPCDCGLGFDPAYGYVGFVIAHLNNEHRWTRERIADWVESVEKQLAARTERAQPEQGSLIVDPEPETSAQELVLA